MMQDIYLQSNETLVEHIYWLGEQMDAMDSYMNREYYDYECFYQEIVKILKKRGLTRADIDKSVKLLKYMKELIS